jgi:hypothetical protein
VQNGARIRLGKPWEGGCAQQPHVAHVGGQRSSSSVPLSKLVLQGSGVSRLVIPETPAASKATTTTSANRRMMGL